MSPCSSTCVWLSMRPGRQVARPRSTTRAPGGAERPAPTSLIRSPSTITTASSTGAACLPSMSRPQRRTVIPGGASAAAWNGARRAVIRMSVGQVSPFMAAEYPLEARKRTRRAAAGAVTGAVCMRCAQRYPAKNLDGPCPRCGPEGVLDIEFDLDRARRALSLRGLDSRPRDQWRYRELLRLPAGARVAPLHVGWTPIEDAPRLARWAGLRGLRLKDESRNPTASFKDRASGVGVARALAGRARVVACASTGNAASSLAGAAASVGLTSVIFVPEFAPEPKVAQLLVFGARVIRGPGSYDETWELCQRACDAYGWYNRNAAVNPSLVEGKKTCGLEIAEQLGPAVPDWVAVSVGDGCTIAGTWKGLREMRALNFIERLPRMLGVQAEGARPLVDAFEQMRDLRPGPARTLADSIR